MMKNILTSLCVVILIQGAALVYSADNESAKYSTKGHIKAKNIDLTVEYPDTWECAEGDRPNIVQKFSKDFHNGILITCGLMIKNVPAEDAAVPEKELAAAIFSGKGIRILLGAHPNVVEHIQTEYDGQPGAMTSFVEERSTAGMDFFNPTLQHAFLYKGKVVILQCSVGGLKTKSEEIEAVYNKYLPVFLFMGGSMVINDKW